jgi:hypothetical protein
MYLILLAVTVAKAGDGKTTAALITGILGFAGAVVTAIIGYFKIREQGRRQADLQRQSDANKKELQQLSDANKKELQGLIDGNQRELQKLVGSQAQDLEKLKFQQTISQEVLKSEVSSIASSRANLTRMASALGRALERVRLLANMARQRRSAAELRNNTIEYKRTIYELFAPIALAELSVRVNPLTEDRYFSNLRSIAHSLRVLMQADDELAGDAGLAYKPGDRKLHGAEPTRENFRVYDRQGVIALQWLLSAFIVEGEPGAETAPYVLDDRSFISGFSKPDFDERIGEAGQLIAEFNPLDKPIFWLILITEGTLARLASNAQSDLRVLSGMVPFTPLERRWFDWRPSLEGTVPDADVLETPFECARAWIGRQLANGKSDLPRAPGDAS